MTAAAQTTEVETRALLDRLAKLDAPLPWAHGSEIEPWVSAARVGDFPLPAEVLDVARKAIHLATLHEKHVAPPAHRDRDVDKLLSGTSVADVLDADDRAAFAKAHWARAGELLIAAESALSGMEADVFASVRDSLITTELREAVATLLKRAKSAAGKLAAFAPNYPPSLLESANDSELKVWRQSRQMQHDFEVMIGAWLASWHRATHHGAPVVPVHFCPSRPGGVWAWSVADEVADDRLRLGVDIEVLRVSTAGSPYQLASPSELPPLVAGLSLVDVRRGVADGH